ncbi:hypothetical protein, conserved [Plasmodium gonderi]|uniref:Leucine-rich repeat protein n=1 Tax=Plasmodium gonderi TaxID=77519 RepID=A0A1Y1JMZ7_PLAGO|nr:hypothetical protein, conserved [Plasmodium gonderi]GAW83859.1 hypothetical protein, conserved [Plasmodium gonderi]
MSHKIKLRDSVIYSSNPIINEDDIADFVSNMNTYKPDEQYDEKKINGDRTNLNLVKEIQLGSLKITPWGMSILIPCILRSRNLVTLNLSNNDLNNDSVKTLAKCLKYLPHLTSINLSNNMIKSDGAIEIVEEFFPLNLTPKKENSQGCNQKGTQDDNKLGDKFYMNSQVKNTPKSGQTNSHKYMRELDLSDNFLGPSVLLKLGQVIKNDKNRIIKLNIKNGKINCNNLSNFFKNCTYVENLNISENNITSTLFPQHIKTLFDAQLNLKELHLSSICFWKNNIHKYKNGNEIFMHLINQLNKSHNLSILTFSNNKINDCGLKFFCDFLRNEKNNITAIDFSNNDISDINCLSESLKDNKTLKIINLSKNKITDENIKHFCYHTLSTNLNISEISLSQNLITNLTCIYIADALVKQSKFIEESTYLKVQQIHRNSSPPMLFTHCKTKGHVSDYTECATECVRQKKKGMYDQDNIFKLDKSDDVSEIDKDCYHTREEFNEINSQKSTFKSDESNVQSSFTCIHKSISMQEKKSKKMKLKNNDIQRIQEVKDLIASRHNDENDFFSCIGVTNFNRASETSKILYLQEKRRNLIYKKNDHFYNSYNSFSINCFKGLKYLNLTGCNINSEGISSIINSLNTPYCPLEFLDISSYSQGLTETILQAFTTLIRDKKYKFIKNKNFHFTHLPLTVRGIPPTLIHINDSDDNTDEDSIESDWWNYKQAD